MFLFRKLKLEQSTLCINVHALEFAPRGKALVHYNPLHKSIKTMLLLIINVVIIQKSICLSSTDFSPFIYLHVHAGIFKLPIWSAGALLFMCDTAQELT